MTDTFEPASSEAVPSAPDASCASATTATAAATAIFVSSEAAPPASEASAGAAIATATVAAIPASCKAALLPLDAPCSDATIATTATSIPTPGGFVKFGLADELLLAVRDLGYAEPTAVQARAIPLALPAGEDVARLNDLMVSSQTGSGKTAAFLLPVLHTLLRRQQAQACAEAEAWARKLAEAAERGEPAPKRPKRKSPVSVRHFKAAEPGALVLCPTRELAQQVARHAIELVRHCKGLRVASVVGGMPYQMQIARLHGASLVVATPGRLLDLQRSLQIELGQVRFLVVDEADRMLDLGFADDLAEINQLTIARSQTMMFSATFAPRIEQLALRVMREGGAAARKVQIDTPQEKHANIRQVLYWADDAQHKRKLLDHWLRDTAIGQAIVFTGTQIECDGLAGDLQQAGFAAVALHGALSQGLRNRRLMALRNGQVQILVATDVAARGIDVPAITHVFNYGLPMKTEDYTHRIGRTGRAGRHGLAVTLAELRERRRIHDIERYSRQTFEADVIPGLEPRQRLEPRPTHGRQPPRGFGARGRPAPAPGYRFEERNARSPYRASDDRSQNESRREDGGRRGPRAFDTRFDDAHGGGRATSSRSPEGWREGAGRAAPAKPPRAQAPARPGPGGKVFAPRGAQQPAGKRAR